MNFLGVWSWVVFGHEVGYPKSWVKNQNDVDGKREIKATKSKLNATSSSMVLKDKCPIQNVSF